MQDSAMCKPEDGTDVVSSARDDANAGDGRRASDPYRTGDDRRWHLSGAVASVCDVSRYEREWAFPDHRCMYFAVGKVDWALCDSGLGHLDRANR